MTRVSHLPFQATWTHRLAVMDMTDALLKNFESLAGT